MLGSKRALAVRTTALVAAAAAALLLPGEPFGIGVTIVFLVVVAAAVTAVRASFDAILLGLLAVTLSTAPAIRDADWVVALDLVAAWLLIAAAVAGRTLASAVTPLLRLRELPEVAPALPTSGAPALRGTVLGGALLTPFGVLFWTGDAAFAELGSRLPLPSLDSLPGRVFTGVVVFLAAVALAFAARRPLVWRASRPSPPLSPWEWLIPLALLDALFLAFVTVQIAVLFGGHEHVLRTSGLTYAEYARQGFWQLLLAAALTFAVVGAAVVFSKTPARSHRLALRLLLGALCLLTIVVVASALWRLLLYEEAFGLTRLRLLAETTSLWFGGMFALLILAAMFERIRRELARIVVVGTAVGLVTFSLLNPDGRIAERNLERWRETGRIDVAYLQTLSADAVPALVALPPELRQSVLDPIETGLAEEEPWSSFNVSRARARDALQGLTWTS